MLFDLIRAVPVALFVGLLPGYLWARSLAATEDLAERLAYAIALSATLVPAVALIIATLLGTGVTTLVTVLSVALVFVTGLAVRLVFGPAKGPEGPISPLPPMPDTATLAPLCLGLLLALGTFFGFIGEWAMIPVAVLVLLSGILYWVSLRRREEPEGGQADGMGASSPAVYGLLAAALVLALARGYLGPVLNGWPFPRGVDRYEHAIMTTMMAERGSTESFMLYPPGFHALSAMISNLSGMEPMALFPALAPTLLALTSLSSYALAARLWGRMAGVAAAFLSGPVLGGAYLHFEEARYPNFVGEQIIIIVAVAALIMVYANPTARSGVLLAVLGSSAVFYHQIAGYVMAVLLAVVTLAFLPYLLLRHRRAGLALLYSLAGLFVLAVLFAWDTYDLPNLVAGLFGGDSGRGGEAVAMAIGTKPANHPTYLLVTITAPVLWLGFFGALMFLPRRANTNLAARLAHLTLIVWAALLFVGSQTSYSGFPDRFDRDLGAPLALLAAPVLLLLVRATPRLAPSRAALALTLAAALLSAGLLVVQTTRNLEEASGPSERPRDRPAPPQVAAAGAWLEENNEGGAIVATPYLDYVPSRGMLAMGGYTEMQSYDYARILRARDLPPFGAGPLRDALWLLKHPTGERTQEIMQENDVRYIIFHKRYPGISFIPYARQTDRYRVAYQNPSVIIFEPRGT